MANVKKTVDALWKQLTEAIAKTKGMANEYERNNFRLLDALYANEMRDEREHRQWREGPYKLAVSTAAKVMILSKVAEGSKLPSMPPSTDWILYRRGYTEAKLLGYLLAADLIGIEGFVETASKLDYAELMKD